MHIGLDEKTRNSLARSTHSLMAQLELDSFYNEPAREPYSRHFCMLLVTCKPYNRRFCVLLVTREFYSHHQCESLVTGVRTSPMWFTSVMKI